MISRRGAIATAAFALATGWRSVAHANPVGDDRIRLPDGRRIAYRRYGVPGGAPVFYFHGLPGCRLEAGLIACEAQAAGVDLISVDRPGMGRSTHHPGRTITDWVDDVCFFADCLGQDTFSVLGMSGGAPYALACARLVPHRIRSMAIVSGHSPMAGVRVAPPGNQERMLRLVGRRPRLSKIAFDVLRARLRRHPNGVLRKLMSSWSECDRRLITSSDELFNLFLTDVRESIVCGTHGVVKEIQLLTRCWGFRLCEITGVPTTIWQGACDPLTPPAMGKYFHHEIAGSEFYLQPGDGHITTLKCNAETILQLLA